MIAEQNALKELEQKQVAKVLVISDSHGYKENLRHALELYAHSSDALLFLGDGIQDLFNIIEENSHIPSDISIIPPVVAFVRGNGDDSVYSLATQEVQRIEIPETQIVTVAGKKIFMSHGHRLDVYYTRDFIISKVQQAECSGGLFGHTHVPFQERIGDILILNPGSCSRPRNYSDKSCVILTIKKDSAQVEYEFYSL